LSSIEVIRDRCVGCELCVPACLYDAIEMRDGIAVIKDNCTLCGACVEPCKFDAIILRLDAQREPLPLDDYHGVWVVAEQRGGEMHGVSYELLGKGRELADTIETSLSAVLIGAGVEGLAQDLIAHGADTVHVVDDPTLAHYLDEPYAAVVASLIEEHKPEIVLTGATSIGRSLIPRVAIRARTGLTADCTGLAIDDEGLLLQTRPAFGGNIMATIVCPNHRPQMATVRHKVMKALPPDASRKGEIVKAKVGSDLLASRSEFVEFVKDLTQTVNIAEADVIVSGGRGLGGPENFKLVEDLASVMGGAVGASRAAVDAGWIPYSHQVGQTGKTVQPKLYVACGISGAVQHLAGMQSSKVIVAINKDPDAPILKTATFGVVGDLFEVLPALTKRLEKELG